MLHGQWALALALGSGEASGYLAAKTPRSSLGEASPLQASDHIHFGKAREDLCACKVPGSEQPSVRIALPPIFALFPRLMK